MIGKTVADAFDAVERDSAHLGETGDGGGFHIDERGGISGDEAAFFIGVGDAGRGDEANRFRG